MPRWPNPRCSEADIVRVHAEHPDWPAAMYVTELDVQPAQVHHVATRRGWKLPNARGWYGEVGHFLAHLYVPIEQVKPFCRTGENPARALRRIFNDYRKAMG